ncbi:MAG TPA: hypothetical protein VFM12_07640, partial [Gemmatimonadales bacterium]|nr:hypothetical protein [Gemmatimonadales bacterium]
MELPLNPDGSVPAPDYFPFQRSVTLRAPLSTSGGGGGGGGNCSGGGAVFGVQASVQTPLVSNLVPGPLLRSQGYELLYHRRSSPEGTGWGIAEVHEAFRAPNLAQLDLVHGDGRRETFFPRVEPDVVGSFTSAILARDPETGELFNLTNTVSRINADWSVTPVTPNLSLSSPRALAIDYADGERRFFVATLTGLYEADAGGVRAQLASWSSQNGTFNRPRVAAGGGAVYFTDGNASVIRRILLNDPLRTVQPIGLPSGGDVRVNPTVPAGQITFDTPRGLAMSPDGSLYVACPRRHMVYRLLPDDDGWVGPGSEVERVLGSGMGSFSSARNGQEVALNFGMNQPLDLSFSDDGFLFVMNTEGLVRFDPLNGMARWFANEREQGLTLQVDGSPAFVALDRDHALVFDSSLALLSQDDWTSEFEPRRRIHETATGLALVDTEDDAVESYDWIDQTHTRARMASRVARTGEPLLSVGYTSAGKVAWLQDPTGGRFSFNYDSLNRLTSIEDAAGRTTHLSIDGSNNLREIEMPTGETRQFEYDGHLMTSATDPRGERTSYVYRDNGTVERVTRPGGASRQFTPAFGEPTYTSGQLVRQGSYTDDRGVAHTIQVDEAGQLIVDQFVADGVSYDLRQVYHGNLTGSFHEDRINKALKITRTTVNGTQVTPTTSWDALGRVTRISTPSTGTGMTSPGARWTLNYDADDRLSLATPGVGNIEHRYQRDANGRLSRMQDAYASTNTLQGRRIDFAWRSDGQLQTLTDHNTPRTYSYDASSGNLLGWTDATGALSLASDGAGNITLQSDGATAISRSYDDSNRLTSITDALGNVTLLGYENESCGCARDDLVTSLVTPDLPPGTQWRLEYDADGRLSRKTDPDGFSVSFTRNASGDVQSITDQLQRSTVFTYDQLGRRKTVRDTAGRLGVYAYPTPVSPAWTGPLLYAGSADSSPAPTDLTAALAPGQYQVGYNALPSGDGPAQIELYRDATFAVSYGNRVDRMLRVQRRQDRSALPISSSTVFGPSSTVPFLDQLYGYNTQTERPIVASIESDYLEESRFESGTFTYNDYFDLSNMDGFGGTSRYAVVGDGYALTRDGAGRVTGLAQRFSTRPASGGATVLYQPPASTYGYDAHGYVKLIDNGSGIQNITYDARGLRSTVALSFQAASTITEGNFSYDYDELGRNVYLQFPDGHVRRQVFDALGRLISRCYEYGGSLGTRCYTAEYDPVGNPIVLTDPEGTSSISYDDL